MQVSWRRVLARDALSKLLAVGFVIGVAVLVGAGLASGSPPAETETQRSIRLLNDQPAEVPRPDPLPIPFIVVGIALVSLLPVRLLWMRAFLGRAVEVEGHIGEVAERAVVTIPNLAGSRARLTVRYTYAFEGASWSGAHVDKLAAGSRYANRIGAAVNVLVDPRQPSRSSLKEIWL